jgi:uncharacterized protein
MAWKWIVNAFSASLMRCIREIRPYFFPLIRFLSSSSERTAPLRSNTLALGLKTKLGVVSMRSFALGLGILCQLLHPSLAESVRTPVKLANTVVTVLTDALGEQASEASVIMREIAILLDKEGSVRVLSISGYGGPANVRDLIQLRGTDLAVVNSDNLTYFDLITALPEARRKVRLVAPLFHQNVFLLARRSIASANDLRGRKIGVPASNPSRGVSARVVFGLLKIDSDIQDISDNDFPVRVPELDAVLIFEKDLVKLPSWGITSASYHLVPLSPAGPLSAVYLPAQVDGRGLEGYSDVGVIETIKVTTLLAAFDWAVKQDRYNDVVSFVEKFFVAVRRYRERFPNALFARTNLKVVMPGWRRFGPAEAPAAAFPVISLNEPAVLAQGAQNTPGPAQSLRIVAVARPPLTSRQDKDGGIVVKILRGALKKGGIQTSIRWVENENDLLSNLKSEYADVGIFMQSYDCENPRNQSASEAAFCDDMAATDPLMYAVVAVLTRIDASLNTSTGEPQTLCSAENHTFSQETLSEIPWLKSLNVRLVRPKTLIDCIAAVDRQDAAALVAIEAEARFAIDKLRLFDKLQIVHRASVTAGLHAVIAKNNPRQRRLMEIINEALKKYKGSAEYIEIITSEFAELTGYPVK